MAHFNDDRKLLSTEAALICDLKSGGTKALLPG